MAPSTIGTLEDTPSFGSKGATLHVHAVDFKEVVGKTVPIDAEAEVAVAGGIGGASLTVAGGRATVDKAKSK